MDDVNYTPPATDSKYIHACHAPCADSVTQVSDEQWAKNAQTVANIKQKLFGKRKPQPKSDFNPLTCLCP